MDAPHTFEGAIFDFDGTLVDSMSLWREVLWRAARRRGVDWAKTDAVAFFDSHEDVSTRDVCAPVQARHPEVWTSPEALYDDVCDEVRRAYEGEVRLLPGVRAVLGSLAQAGVRMAVASSTPSLLVRAGLAAQGIEGLFSAVVSTEDVGGRDKQFPDVYLEAARRLGVAAGRCWVFEDAPFGCASARAAGFRVCALWNDHDGRDPEALAAVSDMLAHGWAEVSLPLLDDFAVPAPAPEPARPCRVLVVDGSPCPSSPALVAALAREADYVVAADRGAMACRAAGVVPQAFVGDADSCDAPTAAWAREVALRTISFPAEKYATDLALALDAARHEAARRGAPCALTLTCASGGRPDHALAVWGLLARAADAAPRLVEDGFEARVLAPGGASCWELGPRALGRTVSVLAPVDAVVSERGLRWELERRRLSAGSDEGVSNVVTSAGARVECSGGVACVVLVGPPPEAPDVVGA